MLKISFYMTFKIHDCYAFCHKIMMLKCAHCIQLMVFIALNKYIGRSMQTKYVKNVTIRLHQVNYCLGYPCVI